MPNAFQEMSENVGLFLWGAVWASSGFLSVVIAELFFAWTGGKPIAWDHTLKLAAASTAPALIGYWKSHQNLLALPASVQGKLNLAQAATIKASEQMGQISQEAGSVYLPSLPIQSAQSDKIQVAVAALNDLKHEG